MFASIYLFISIYESKNCAQGIETGNSVCVCNLGIVAPSNEAYLKGRADGVVMHGTPTKNQLETR